MKLINKKTYKILEIDKSKITEYNHSDWAMLDCEITEETYLISLLEYNSWELFDTVINISYFEWEERINKQKAYYNDQLDSINTQRSNLRASLYPNQTVFNDWYVKSIWMWYNSDLEKYISDCVAVKEKIMKFEDMDEQWTTAEGLWLEKCIDEEWQDTRVWDSEYVTLYALYEQRNYYKALQK